MRPYPNSLRSRLKAVTAIVNSKTKTFQRKTPQEANSPSFIPSLPCLSVSQARSHDGYEMWRGTALSIAVVPGVVAWLVAWWIARRVGVRGKTGQGKGAGWLGGWGWGLGVVVQHSTAQLSIPTAHHSTPQHTPIAQSVAAATLRSTTGRQGKGGCCATILLLVW